MNVRFDFIEVVCVRKTPPEFDWNRSFSVLPKHDSVQINIFIFSKNIHNHHGGQVRRDGREFKFHSRYMKIKDLN